MTREEAINRLKAGAPFSEIYDHTWDEALNMAISALSAEPFREADDYENEIADLHNRLDIAEYDKERYKEEITTLEAENKGEWIPVSERLPERNIACLVAVGKLNLTQMAMYSDLMGTISNRIFYQGDVGYDSFIDITEYVKAWQPLPEPYKAESKDPNDLTHMFDGVTEIPKDAFKGWTIEKMLEQIRAESEDKE